MAETTYGVLTYKDAEAAGYTGDTDFGETDSGWPRMAVFRIEDGVPVEEIGGDGGEPEDNTLRRDWSWVAPALQKAYELGWSNARSEFLEGEHA